MAVKGQRSPEAHKAKQINIVGYKSKVDLDNKSLLINHCRHILKKPVLTQSDTQIDRIISHIVGDRWLYRLER